MMKRHVLAWLLPLTMLSAGSIAEASDVESRGVSHHFGLTWCGPDVGAEVACDYRFGAPAERNVDSARSTAKLDRTLDLFGKKVCLGAAAARSDCDLRFGAPAPEPPAPEPRDKVISLMGMNICVGPTSDSALCHVRVPSADLTTKDARAQL